MSTLPRKAQPHWRRGGLVLAGLATAAAAATATWVAYRARRAEEAHRPAGQFITVDGVRLHYLDRGQGTPVVLLHGNVVHAEDFVVSGLLDRLARNHRVIAFDRPGFGHSERPRDRLWTADAQAALLEHTFPLLGIEHPVVLGHSWGTLVALALARRTSAAVRKLVLVSGCYFPTVRADVALAAPPALPVVGDALRYTISPVFARLLLNRLVTAMFAPQRAPAYLLPTLGREMLVRPSQIRASAEDAAFLIPSAAALRKHYGELNLPVAIFAGEKDTITEPDTHARRLHAALPSSELYVLPGVGHMLHYVEGDQLIDAIESKSITAPETPNP